MTGISIFEASRCQFSSYFSTGKILKLMVTEWFVKYQNRPKNIPVP